MASKSIPYLNYISVAEGSVVSIIPKSKRRSYAKYAIGSVKFEIKERSIENLSEQDFMIRTQFSYTSRVVDLVKLSKRNKHAKNPFIAISIEAEIVDEDVPMKSSVPKIDRKALAEAEITYNTEIYEIAEKLLSMEEQVLQAVEKDMPLPIEPKKPLF